MGVSLTYFALAGMYRFQLNPANVIPSYGLSRLQSVNYILVGHQEYRKPIYLLAAMYANDTILS